MTSQLPRRPRAHELETLSRQYVERIFPPDWICRRIDEDYGLDLRVEIVTGGQVTGLEFSIQLKATDTLQVSKNDIIYDCEVTTAHYFLHRPEPVMFVVFDAQANAAYWLWIKPYLHHLDNTRSGWHDQKTTRIRIPHANRLTSESIPAIAEYVNEWWTGIMLADRWGKEGVPHPGYGRSDYAPLFHWGSPVVVGGISALLFELIISAAKTLMRRNRLSPKVEPEPAHPVTAVQVVLPSQASLDAETTALLRPYIPRERATDDELSILAGYLNHQPLAMTLAAHYLAHHSRQTVADYVENLEAVSAHPVMKGWQDDPDYATGHDLNLMMAFALNWTVLTDENARQLFIVAGYCAPNQPIPNQVLQEATRLDNETLDQALNALVDLGLLQLDGPEGSPQIDPTLAEYARYQARGTEPLLRLVEALVILSDPANEASQPERSDLLRPHIERVAIAIHKSPLSIGSDLDTEQKLKIGALWSRLIQLDMLADDTRALEACLRARETKDMISLAIGLNNLAWTHIGMGRFTTARRYSEESLSIGEQQDLGALIAFNLSTLGLINARTGRLAPARSLCEKALPVFQNLDLIRGVGLTQIIMSETLRRMNTERLGDPLELLKRAGDHVRQAVEVFTNLVPERPRAVEAFCELGCVYREWAWFLLNHEGHKDETWRGLAEESMVAFRHAIDAAGEDLPFHGIDARVNLAWTHFLTGDDRDAHRLVSDALERLPIEHSAAGYKEESKHSPTHRIFWVPLGKAHLLLGHLAYREFQQSDDAQHLEEMATHYALALAYYEEFASDFVETHWAMERVYDCLGSLDSQKEILTFRDAIRQTVNEYGLVSTLIKQMSIFLDVLDREHLLWDLEAEE